MSNLIRQVWQLENFPKETQVKFLEKTPSGFLLLQNTEGKVINFDDPKSDSNHDQLAFTNHVASQIKDSESRNNIDNV